MKLITVFSACCAIGLVTANADILEESKRDTVSEILMDIEDALDCTACEVGVSHILHHSY
jgi:hypothetical protein